VSTEEPNSAEQPEPEGDEESPLDRDAGDPNLSVLVRIANTGAMTMGVTLLVGGAVVSGLLVGSIEYFESLASRLEEEGGEGGQALADVYRTQAGEFREQMPSDFDEAFGAPYVATFIHLKNAHVFSPSGAYIPKNQGTHWRGRLDSVDAWSIGSITT